MLTVKEAQLKITEEVKKDPELMIKKAIEFNKSIESIVEDTKKAKIGMIVVASIALNYALNRTKEDIIKFAESLNKVNH